MAVLVSPGVLTREIDLSLYVPALTSTILGMVGTTTKGLTDVPYLITDVTQLAKELGDPDPNHPAILTAQWYLKFGRQLQFVRVANQSTLATAAANLGSANAGPAIAIGANAGPFTFAAATAASVTGTEVGPFNVVTDTNDKLTIAVNGGGDQVVTLDPGTLTTQDVVDAVNAGTTGLTAEISSGRVKITSNTTGSTSSIQIKTVANNAYTTLGLTVATTAGTAGTDSLKVSVTGGGDQTITLGSGSNTAAVVRDAINATLTGAVATVVAGAIVLTTTATGSGVSIQVKTGGTAQTVLGLATTLHNGSDAGANSIIVAAISPGTWGEGLTIKISDSATLAGAKNVVVMLNGFTEEVFRNLVKDSTASTYWQTAINGKSEFITVEDQVGVGGQPANSASIPLSGGNDGLSGLSDADFIGIQGDGYTTGMQVFADPATMDINLVVAPGQSSMNVHAALISLVSARGDSMTILDPPSGLSPTQVVDFKRAMNGYSDRVALNSNRAAMYYPWVKGYDPKNRIVVDLPPSAAAIRSYIYNDTVAQLWFAPMGVNRGLIPEAVGIERTIREGEKDFLYENGVNSIMNYHNYGVTIMGEKTLQVLPTSLDRVNVRRMLDYLHKVAVTVTFGLIGEPNTPRLWRRFVALLVPTMQFLKDQEGVAAYQVVCDASTNPQNLVNAHELHAKIGILPVADAEFIYTDFVLVDSMATFQEYLAPTAQ